MSRDAYMDVGGRATQDAKAEDRMSGATGIQEGLPLDPGLRRGDKFGPGMTLFVIPAPSPR